MSKIMRFRFDASSRRLPVNACQCSLITCRHLVGAVNEGLPRAGPAKIGPAASFRVRRRIWVDQGWTQITAGRTITGHRGIRRGGRFKNGGVGRMRSRGCHDRTECKTREAGGLAGLSQQLAGAARLDRRFRKEA